MADDSRARSIRAVSSSFVPLSERLGPGLPNRRAGFDSLAVLETACVDPVMPHGVARTGTSALCRIYQGGEVATQTAVNRPTAGSNPAPGAPHARGGSPPGGSGAALRRPRWEFESPRGDKHMVRYASGKGGGCLPPKASSSLVRTASIVIHARVAQLEEAMRSDRIQCGFESRPGYHKPSRGRVAQRQCSRMISGRREVRLLPRPHRP